MPATSGRVTIINISIANNDLSKRDLIYNHYVYGDTWGTVIEESTSIPLIVYMLYIVVLVTACYSYFSRDGYINYHISKETYSNQPKPIIEQTTKS
jgi:hypothetical protein